MPQNSSPLIIAGDFNAGTTTFKSTLHINIPHDRRTAYFDEFIVSNGLTIHNYEKPTWHARGLHSITDYTLSRNAEVHNWSIDQQYVASDHDLIKYNIPLLPKLSPNRDLIKITDKDKYSQLIQQTPTMVTYNDIQSLDFNTNTIISFIQEAIESSTTTITKNYEVPYWNKDLNTLRD